MWHGQVIVAGRHIQITIFLWHVTSSRVNTAFWRNAGVSIAVSHVNEGNLAAAIDILDHIIATTSGAHLSGAHVARGTARAMMRDLKGLIL